MAVDSHVSLASDDMGSSALESRTVNVTRRPSAHHVRQKRATTVTPVERLLTYREAGEVLGVSERTVWAAVDQGELPAVRFRRSVRIDPADLRSLIDHRKVHGKGVTP